MTSQLFAALQYGALGLVALVLVGVAWYVRSVEGRQGEREAFEREERKRFLDAQMGLIRTLTLLSERVESHEARAAERHGELLEQYERLCNRMETSLEALGPRGKGSR